MTKITKIKNRKFYLVKLPSGHEDYFQWVNGGLQKGMDYIREIDLKDVEIIQEFKNFGDTLRDKVRRTIDSINKV